MTTAQQDAGWWEAPGGWVQQAEDAAAADDVRAEFATALLRTRAGIARYMAMSGPQLDVVTLWAANSYAFEVFDTTPYLFVTSPVRGSGKSQLFDVLAMLSARSEIVAGTTVAGLYLCIEAHRPGPTLLLDEIDQQTTNMRGEIMALLNTGYRRGGQILRANRRYGTYCPKALAGIGQALPVTLHDRCITIDLQRALPDERPQPWRERDARNVLGPIARELEAAVENVVQLLDESVPVLPDVVNANRRHDLWHPLFCVADVAGDDWPERARLAAIELTDTDEEIDPKVQLLQDVSVVLAECVGREFVRSEVLVTSLRALEDPAYEPCHNINAVRLANLLRSFKVKPESQRLPGFGVVRCYRVAELLNVCNRYVR